QLLKIDLTGVQANVNDYKLYAGGLYVLSSEANQIYRFGLKGDTFSSPTSWLKEAVDLKNTNSLTIDGTIYVLKADGNILKLYRNKKQDLSVSIVVPAFTSANRLITSAKYFYVFELSSKRLAIFNKVASPNLKAGQFLAQFDLTAFEALKDIEINEGTKEAYVLNDTSVYKIKLNY
ncbi:MAG: hypothetical protein NTX66_04225, partial [Candidatus Falkowbacteria bacterium]|nr:hypothetical protein [Candidatus Falkowbacteria bacterium]